MKLALSQIEKNTIQGPYTFEDTVDMSEIVELNNDVRKISPITVKAICTMEGDEIIFSLHIKGEMILPCARTLVDVLFPFDIHTDEVYSVSPYYSEEDAENEVHEVKGEVLDLTPQIRENILLEVPFRVFSDDQEAQENVPTEGQGWEIVTEEKEDDSIDPRMKKLEQLLKDKKDK